jgi:hypothetical protein
VNRATPLPLIDCKVEELIAFVATHAWQESRLLHPRPSVHVPVYPLLEKIEKLWELTPEQIDQIMVEAQEAKEKKP